MMKVNPIMILNFNDYVAFFMTSFRHSWDSCCQKSNVLIQKHQCSKLKFFISVFCPVLYNVQYTCTVLSFSPWIPWYQRLWWRRISKLHSLWKPLCMHPWGSSVIVIRISLIWFNLQGVPKNYPSGIYQSGPKWWKVVQISGPTGPKICYGFVFEKFQRGIFLSYPVLNLIWLKQLNNFSLHLRQLLVTGL